jgi:hypothetical protein
VSNQLLYENGILKKDKNPQYGRDIKHWIEKAYQESLNGNTGKLIIQYLQKKI